MTITNLDWWYDKQQYRFIQQLVRAFSGFQYQTGYNGQGAPQLLTVPCTLAETNRQVANILRNNSENTLLSAPRITIWQSGLTGRREDVQYPGFVDTLQVVERGVDASTTPPHFTTERGNAYTVQRLMPRPFAMDVQVDLWTTNLDQRYQLLEQILTIIYPSFDIQNSQNAIDWTALTTVYVEDITLSSRNIPVGTENEIDIATIRLRVPIWLSPPAKVKSQNIIQQIISNIFDADAADLTGYGGATGSRMARDITTPGEHSIAVDGGVITLLNSKASGIVDGTDNRWIDLLNQYGLFKPAQSRIMLYYTDDFETGPFVSGTIQLDPEAANQLRWTIDPDTIPDNTLPAIDALIDPLRSVPGGTLPTAPDGSHNGQYFLIASDIGRSLAWGTGFSAAMNDIITCTAGVWSVAFASRRTTTPQFRLNRYTNRQLRWTGSDWVMSIDARYAPGFWRLRL